MNIGYYAVLLLTVLAVGFYPKESFAPIIPDSNNTINTNETASQSYAFGSLYFKGRVLNYLQDLSPGASLYFMKFGHGFS